MIDNLRFTDPAFRGISSSSSLLLLDFFAAESRKATPAAASATMKVITDKPIIHQCSAISLHVCVRAQMLLAKGVTLRHARATPRPKDILLSLGRVKLRHTLHICQCRIATLSFALKEIDNEWQFDFLIYGLKNSILHCRIPNLE